MSQNKDGVVYVQREFQATGYRKDYLRKRMLQKSFKGGEKGYKHLDKISETVHMGMEVLWRQRKMCDVILVARDKKQVLAHRLVLSTVSDFFYDIFADDDGSGMNRTDRVDISELDGDTLETIVESVYTGKLKIDANSVDILLASAQFLGLFPVMEACENFLIDHLTKENCLQILVTAFKYDFGHLIEKALGMAAKWFSSVTKRPTFKSLSIEHIIPLLKRNDLNVESELDVFQRARSWIESGGASRIHYAAEIMATIRLPLLTPAQVIDNVECCSFLMGLAECQRLVKESLHYHLMPARQCLLQTPRTVPRAKAELCLIVTGGSPRLDTCPVSSKVVKYDRISGQWSHVTNMPEPRHHHAAAVFNGFLYIAGGDSSTETISPSRSVYRFDPRTGDWMAVAPMLSSRQSFQMTVLGSALYAIGGRQDQETCIASVERYDPALDSWIEVASLSGPRRCVAVACYAGKIYAVGGSGSKAVYSRAERYSPTENRWELLRSLSTPRFFAHLYPIGGFLYLVGGATINDSGEIACVDSIERYSPAANQWTFVTKMRTPRSEFGSANIDEKIYVIGGYNWSDKKRPAELECFDTDTGTWTGVGELEEAMTGIVACTIVLYDKTGAKDNNVN